MGRRNGNKGEGAPQGQAPPAPEQPTPPQQQTGGGRKPPAAEFRCGRIRATVWQNESESHGAWYSVVLTRSYKKDDGTWASAASLGRDDLLVAGEVLRMAYHFINKEYGGGRVEKKGEAEQGEPQNTEEPIPF